jgi:epidermal growth factor receptor substrate 15
MNTLKPQIKALETDKIRLQGEVQSQTEQLIQETVLKEQAIAEVDILTQAIEQLESEKQQLQAELVTSRQDAAATQTKILEAEAEIEKKTIEIAESQKKMLASIEPITAPVEEVLESPPPVLEAIAESPIPLEIAEIPEIMETPVLQAEPLPEVIETLPSEAESLPEVIETLPLETESLPDATATPLLIENPLEELEENIPQATNFFANKKFIIVGTLSKMNREQAKTLIQEAGGSVTSSASSKTNYVLVGKSPGDKLKKAQKLGISQLTESKFLTLLGMEP